MALRLAALHEHVPYYFRPGDHANEPSSLRGFRVRFRRPLPSAFMT